MKYKYECYQSTQGDLWIYREPFDGNPPTQSSGLVVHELTQRDIDIFCPDGGGTWDRVQDPSEMWIPNDVRRLTNANHMMMSKHPYRMDNSIHIKDELLMSFQCGTFKNGPLMHFQVDKRSDPKATIDLIVHHGDMLDMRDWLAKAMAEIDGCLSAHNENKPYKRSTKEE